MHASTAHVSTVHAHVSAVHTHASAVHAIELLVVSTVAALPAAVIAFSCAAAAHRTGSRGRRFLWLLATFASWHAAILVMRFAATGFLHDWPSDPALAVWFCLSVSPLSALFASAHVTLAAAVRSARRRVAVATGPACLFIGATLLAGETRPLADMPLTEAAGIAVLLFGGVALAAVSLGLVHIRTPIGRCAAALTALAGMQYARLGTEALIAPSASLFRVQAGFVTPTLMWALAFFVAATALVAIADWRHGRDQHRSASRIRDLAARDALTGLLNRRAFDHRIDAGAEGSRRSLMMIDLDRFKAVNDAYGHAAGDCLLRTLAGRFEAEIAGRGDLARLGGDEFAALVGGNPDSIRRLGERLRQAASVPVVHDRLSLDVGASVGIAPRPPSGDPEEWRRNADLALYAAKHEGRDRVVVFSEEMGRDADERLRFRRDLRAALSEHQFLLHYQAQQDLRSGRTIGYEALLRWNHPERGLVPPNLFIPLAEETGLIAPVGRWVLERAARDFADLADDLRVSVNVSPVQIETSDIVEDVRIALRQSGLAPHRLELEVTESALMKDTEGTRKVLEALRGLGVGLSLDDFGTGYASLATLTRFPFSKLKIDRAFVDAMGTDDRSRALVRSILAMAASLSLRVTAEGVETHGQLLALAQGACDEAQGFLLGRPAAFEDLARTEGWFTANGEPLALQA